MSTCRDLSLSDHLNEKIKGLTWETHQRDSHSNNLLRQTNVLKKETQYLNRTYISNLFWDLKYILYLNTTHAYEEGVLIKLHYP